MLQGARPKVRNTVTVPSGQASSRLGKQALADVTDTELRLGDDQVVMGEAVRAVALGAVVIQSIAGGHQPVDAPSELTSRN